MGPRWRWADGVLWRAVTEGVIVLAPGMDAPCCLRGAIVDEVWLAFRDGADPDAVVKALVADIEADLGEEVDRARVADTVDIALEKLAGVGALVDGDP